MAGIHANMQVITAAMLFMLAVSPCLAAGSTVLPTPEAWPQQPAQAGLARTEKAGLLGSGPRTLVPAATLLGSILGGQLNTESEPTLPAVADASATVPKKISGQTPQAVTKQATTAKQGSPTTSIQQAKAAAAPSAVAPAGLKAPSVANYTPASRATTTKPAATSTVASTTTAQRVGGVSTVPAQTSAGNGSSSSVLTATEPVAITAAKPAAVTEVKPLQPASSAASATAQTARSNAVTSGYPAIKPTVTLRPPAAATVKPAVVSDSVPVQPPVKQSAPAGSPQRSSSSVKAQAASTPAKPTTQPASGARTQGPLLRSAPASLRQSIKPQGSDVPATASARVPASTTPAPNAKSQAPKVNQAALLRPKPAAVTTVQAPSAQPEPAAQPQPESVSSGVSRPLFLLPQVAGLAAPTLSVTVTQPASPEEPKTVAAAASAAPAMETSVSQAAASPLSSITSQAVSFVGGLLGMLGFKVSLLPGPQTTGSTSTSSTTAAAVPKPTAAAVPKPVPQMPQVPPGYVPMCEWRSDLNACWVGRKYFLAVEGRPFSFVSKLVSAAAARDYGCSAFTTPSACNDLAPSSLKCSWAISSGPYEYNKGCRSTYMAEWDAFAVQRFTEPGDSVKAAEALAHMGALMCPGSIAQKTQGCSNIYPMDQYGNFVPGICQQGTGCAYQASTHACVTSQATMDLIAALDPRFVGTCSSACYLRMLEQCHKASTQPAATREAWCEKQQGCMWEAGLCKPDLYMRKLDKWGTQVAAASSTCGNQKGEFACAGAAVEGMLPYQPVGKRAMEFVTSAIDTGSTNAKCPV